MKKLIYKIDIAAPKKKVWETMLNPITYKEWSGAAWPGSYYVGEWKRGEKIKFLSPNMGGTLVIITECKPYDFISAEHIAVINSDGSEDRSSETSKTWIGTTESYTFTGENGKTILKVEANAFPEWEEIFNDWRKGLAKLKEICER